MIYKKENIDMSLVQCPYEEERGYIYISDEYTNNILKLTGYDEISDDNFRTMFYYKCLVKYLPEYAIKSPSNAYHYSCDVHGGRFELGEKLIATDPHYSYYYAGDVVNDRFVLGEPVIATNTHYSYKYAADVIKGRFELGEPSIATDPYYSYMYAKNVLKGRFKLGDTIIAGDCSIKKHYFDLTGIQL